MVPPAADWPLGKPIRAPPAPCGEDSCNRRSGLPPYPVDNVVPQSCWLRAVDVRPGNRKVVHHVILRAKSPSGADDGSGRGVRISRLGFRANRSILPRGSGTVLSQGRRTRHGDALHHHGLRAAKPTEIGLYVMTEKPVTETHTKAGFDLGVLRLPGEANSRTFATYRFPEGLADLQLQSPHARAWLMVQVRGASPERGKGDTSTPGASLRLQLADGIPPQRTEARAQRNLNYLHGRLDNSAKNPFNSDPGKHVRLGRSIV